MRRPALQALHRARARPAEAFSRALQPPAAQPHPLRTHHLQQPDGASSAGRLIKRFPLTASICPAFPARQLFKKDEEKPIDTASKAIKKARAIVPDDRSVNDITTSGASASSPPHRLFALGSR